MNVSLLLAALLVFMAVAIGLDQAMRRVRAARKRYQTVIAKQGQQTERLRAAARESLTLGREVRNIQRTADLLSEELIRFEEEMHQLARPENRIFVLDERRGVLDRGWLVIVDSAGPQPDSRQMPPWVGSRRFRVWAADEAAARAKVERRYPPDGVYLIQTIQPLTMPTPANSSG
ncbi:hypothetical protein GE253_00735 [Niveispirillum sp. SYP-B3756]|uniref:hypothetical protein n=1 Tax=Niveispirillum sp. SYP-B3756 TaxID=2662178 RepID=UPI0012929CE9|nr:hypothetical protein [Niveispirillum sp. SYP-B3756]MQP63861.1 hypothetical protein [Niveispirillum sp. SYP-B3756]